MNTQPTSPASLRPGTEVYVTRQNGNGFIAVIEEDTQRPGPMQYRVRCRDTGEVVFMNRYGRLAGDNPKLEG